MADKAKEKSARKRKKGGKPQNSFWRTLMLVGGASILTLIIVVMLLSNFFDVPALKSPGNVISRVMTPVQTIFSGAVNVVGNYFRTLNSGQGGGANPISNITGGCLGYFTAASISRSDTLIYHPEEVQDATDYLPPLKGK